MKKNVFNGRVLSVNIEVASLPDGRQVELEIIRHPGGACVLPVLENGDVVLIHQFRHAAGGMIWEIPAGRIDHNEEPESCARRELKEEAGYETDRMEKIGECLTTPGFCTELLHIYLATHLIPCEQEPEEDEYIEIVRIPFKKAIDMVMNGEILDSKTVIALLLAERKLT